MSAISILLIDDDPANLNSLKGYLEAIHHYSVSSYAESGPALKALRKHPDGYHALIMDWTLQPSGEEILDKIKELAPDIPVIVFTANAEAGAKAYGKGAYAYFQKPVDPERLVQEIQGATNKDRTSAEKSLELVNIISTLLVEQQTLEAFAAAIINKANSLVGSSTGCFYLWNWKEKTFQKLAGTGSKNSPKQVSPTESGRILGAFSKGETDILIFNNRKGEAFQAFSSTKVRSQAALLLHRGDLHLGLLVLDKAEEEFKDQDTKILRALKTMVEPLLEQMNARDLLQKIERKNYTSEEILGEAVVNAVFELFGKPAALWLIDLGHTEFKIQSSNGLLSDYKNNARIKHDDANSLIASVINTGKVNHWENIGTPLENIRPSELEGLEQSQINTILAIPLFTSENAPIGVITIYGTQKNTFKEYDIQLAQNFAAQASKVLENLRRQWQSKKLAELSETLATRGQDEKSIFETFAKAVLELTGAYNIAIYPYDSKQKHWFDASQVIIQGQLLREQKITEKPRERGLAVIVRHTGKILVEDIREGVVSIQPIENLEKIPDKRKITMAVLEEIVAGEKFIRREKIRAFAGISLRAPQVQAEVGVMYVNFQAPRHFTESEISILQIAARQVASIVHGSVRQQTISKTLEEIINAIGTQDALTVILEQTVGLFSADYGTINRLTQDGKNLQYEVRLTAGKKPEIKTDKDLSPISTGITGHVIQTGEPFRTGDVSKVKFYNEWFPGTKSEMAIPLKNAFGAGAIGVLNLESVYADFFTKEDEKLCDSFAHAASAAIQQSELFDAIKSLHGLTESRTLKDLLDQVLKNLNKMMGKNTASSVNLYDQEKDDFHVFYGVSPDQEFTEEYLMLPPRKDGAGTGRHVIETEQPLYYDDVDNISEGLPKIRPESKKWEIVSYAVLPLMYQGRILGTLYIHKIREKTTFTDDAIQILETYADQAALAIHNAQHRVDIEPLKEILDATVSRNRKEILNLIVEKAVDVVTADYSSLFMGEGESGDLVQKAIYIRQKEKKYFSTRKDKILSTQGSTNITAYNNKESVIVNDVSLEEIKGNYDRIYKKAKSEIVVPLVFRGKVIGTLNAESQYLGAYSEFDAKTLGVFADVAATAIKVAQDREEIQKKNEEIQGQTKELSKRGEDLHNMNYRLERRNASFEALTEIGQGLTANIRRSEQQILSIIHQQASRIIDTNNMYVALYDREKDLVRFELAFLDGKPVDVNKEEDWKPRSGGHGRTEWIIKKKAAVLTYTKADAEAWYQQPDTKDYIGQTFASWLGVPIMFGDEVMGVIATYHKTEEYKYAPDDMKILSLMGRQAAIALKNARLVRQLDKRIIELDTIRELGEDLSKIALPS